MESNSIFFRFACGVLILAAASLGFSAESAGEDEKVLLPVYLPQPLPGAFGSLWTTDFWMRNEGSQPIAIRWFDWCGTGPCFEGSPPPLPPNITFKAMVVSSVSSGHQGVFLFVDRRYASDATFSLRVRDLSRQTMTWGTEVPVVREGEFRTKKLSLVDVPTGSQFRQVLRIYNLDGLGIAQVTIRIYKLNPEKTLPFPDPDLLLGERVMSFQTAAHLASISPGYIELSDLKTIAPLSGTERVRIEIEPVTPGLQYWAFVTVVNNETQHLTVISPSLAGP